MYDELNDKYKKKIIDKNDLLKIIGNHPRQKKVIMCHGVFDVVHPGHIRHLAYAKSKADILVASLTCDKHVSKGKYRPHVPENLRAYSLAAFDMVDYVIIDENPKPIENLKILKPDLFAKGFEYSDDLPDDTLEEIKIINNYGGEILFSPGDIIYSSSKLLESHLPHINNVKLISLLEQTNISIDEIIENVKKLSQFKVHVIGDTIVDTYTRTTLVGGNIKTPTFSVLYGGHEDYVGGAGIVARHIEAAGAEVIFTSVIGNDELGKFVQKEMSQSHIECNLIIDENRPTTNKNVIIAESYRLLKVDKLDNSPFNQKLIEQLSYKISSIEADCVIFSDFRHGMFSKNSIKTLTNSIKENIFKVADSQVASRWGNITEFQKFDLVTPNEREARFALADQDSNIGNLAGNIKKHTNAENVILKLGDRGVFFLDNQFYQSVDSFANNIKDAVGAGDALLAYATLMMLKTKSLPQAVIVGSVAAALECEYDGNKPVDHSAVIERLISIKNKISN
jgi:rfaE bifunctional protein kinase chain/domain